MLYHAGLNNMFKHPSKSTIDRISTYIEKINKGKGKIYRTDLSGEIVIELDKKNIKKLEI